MALAGQAVLKRLTSANCSSSASLAWSALRVRRKGWSVLFVIGCVAQFNKMMPLVSDQKGLCGHPTHYYRH